MTGVDMTMNKIRPGTIILFAALLLIGACSGDSPTAPPPGGGNGGGGGTSPPTGAEITLEVSNTDPLVNSTSTITATVTDDGKPVPDGTAVEFKTSFGTFVVGQSTASTVVRTTTNGKATVTITSTAAGQAVVTARVNNVFKQATVTFKPQGTEPPPPGEPTPTITSVSPASGPPEGGTVVTIRGQNFEGPVRVLFGDREATVASLTSTELKVVSPNVPFEVGEEQREVPITVIFEAGTTGETSVQAPTAFRYQVEFLTPQVVGVSPSSGPNEGGTQIAIIGSGFQAPVRVFFGTGADEVEADVQQVTFNQIIALTPKASGLGAGLANQQVPIRVRNVTSGLEVVTEPVFRYGPGMKITGISPTSGPATGGTTVTIFGWGFDDPVAVSFGDTSVQPIKVSGTEIVVVTPTLANPCAAGGGPVTVTNLEEGGEPATGPAFTFAAVNPVIVGIAPSAANSGSNVNITVANAGPGTGQFTIGGSARPPVLGNPTTGGNTVYTVSVPALTEADFPVVPCNGGEGERFVNARLQVSFLNLTTGCPATNTVEVEVIPPDTSCRIPAVASVSPSSLNFGDQDDTAGPTAAQTFTVTNAGGGTLTIVGVASDDPQFAVTGTVPASLGANESTSYSVTFDPNAVGAQSGTITVTTGEGDTVTVTVSGNGI